jgi:hypothetical protein
MRLKTNLKAYTILLILANVFSVSYPPKSTTDVQVNTTPGGMQRFPVAATLSNGNFAVTWESVQTTTDINAQIIDANLRKVGSEIAVLKTTTGEQNYPFVADVRGQNKFVVAWQDKTTGFMSFRLFDYTGVGLTNEIVVNTNKSMFVNDDTSIRVTTNSLGTLFFTWQTFSGGSDWNVRGRIYDPTGSPLTGDILLHPTSTADQSRPFVCTLKNDNYVLVYHNSAPGTYDIYFKIYDSTGQTVVTPDTVVNYNLPTDQYFPVCAGLADGGFVIAFVTKFWGVSYDLAFRIFDKNASPKHNSDIKINTVVTDWYVTVAALSTGGFVVAYPSLVGDVYYQVFAYDGTSVMPETRINVFTPNKQQAPYVASYSDNRFVISWDSEFQLNTVDKEVYTNLFTFVGDCKNLQAFSGKGDLNLINFGTLPGTTIRITQNPTNGAMTDSNKAALDNTTFYPIVGIYYTSMTSINDTFYYMNNKGDLPCKLDILMCYVSCKTCTVVGTSQANKCLTCLTAENYYPLSDDSTQCYKNTDTVSGYTFDATNSIFAKACYKSCSTCSGLGTSADNKCLTCFINGGYYPTSAGSTQCYLKTDTVPRFYWDASLNLFNACYTSCSTCTAKGDSTNNNCTACATNYYPTFDKASQCYLSTGVAPGYYFDKTSSTFLACYIGCNTCTGPATPTSNNCLSCKTSSYYYQIEDQPTECPLINATVTGHFFNVNKFSPCDISCSTCTTATECTTCNFTGGYYQAADNSAKCFDSKSQPIGYYFDSSKKVFEPCYSNCKTCTGYVDMYNQMCSTCKDGYFPTVDNPTNCYPGVKGPDGYYLNGTIFSKCYDACLTCSGPGTFANPNCLTCKDGANCNPCNDIAYLNQCIKSCPSDTAYDATNKTCYICLDIKKSLFNSNCVDSCPPGYYSSNGVCGTCTSNQQVVLDGKCVDKCPDGYTLDKTQTCQKVATTVQLCGDSCAEICTPDSCKNSGTCAIKFNKVTCTCTAGYIGQYCQYVSTTQLDFCKYNI